MIGCLHRLWQIVRPIQFNGEDNPVYRADCALEESRRAMHLADEMVAQWDREDRDARDNWLANELNRAWGGRRHD